MSIKQAYSYYIMNPSQEQARALRKAINRAGIEKQPVDEKMIIRMFEFVFLTLSKTNAKTNINGIYKIDGSHVQPTTEQMLQALQKELGKSRYEITAICTPAVRYYRYKLGGNSHNEDVVAQIDFKDILCKKHSSSDSGDVFVDVAVAIVPDARMLALE